MVLNIDMTEKPAAPQPVRWAYAIAAAFLVIAALNVAVHVVGIAKALQNPVVEVSFDPPRHVPSEPGAGGSGDDPVAAVILENEDTAKAVVLELPPFLVAVFLAAMASLVFAFFARTRAGRPFAPENARDLRFLAVLLALVVPVSELADDLEYRFVADGTTLPPSIDGFGLGDVVTAALIVALAAWALSTTLEYGSELAADAAVTI